MTATVLSRNVCKLSATNVLAMDFGAIDASSLLPQTKQLTWTFTCNGSSAVAAWSMTSGDGLHAIGPGLRRMQHGAVATEFLPYSLAISPTAGTAAKGTAITVTLTGTVAPSAFQSALPGSYSDTVAITVAP